MTLSVWQRNVVTESGDIIPDAEIEVFDAGEASKPDLFSDPAGTTAITNPFNADTSGFARFYVAGGRYDIAVNGVVTWEDVNLELISDHATETGGIHGIPANERALHSQELRAAVSTATTTAEAISMTGKGAIVESDTNSNGHYIRWENGEQVCWISRGRSVNWAVGTPEPNAEWTFPAEFVSRPDLTNALVMPTSSNRSEGTLWVDVSFSPHGERGADGVSGFTQTTELRGGSVRGVTDSSSGDMDVVAEEFTVMGFWK